MAHRTVDIQVPEDKSRTVNGMLRHHPGPFVQKILHRILLKKRLPHLLQALGVFIDTIVICSCTAFLMLLVPQDLTAGLSGMDLLQTAMQYHLGGFGTVFIAATLALFSFSPFLGVLYYARGNVAYLCGDNWWSQTVYKLIALVMLLIGGLQAYTVVWDLGDVGIGLMTIFNMIALYPLSGEAMDALNDYEKRKKLQ